jgi:hypothetical protein
MNFSVITNISFVPGDTFDTDTSGDITCTAMGSGGWAHLGGFGSTVQLELAYTLELSLGRRDTCQTNAAGINTCNYYVTQWCNQTPDLSVTTIRAIANPIPNYWDVWAVCTRTSQGAVWLCPTASVGLVGNAYAFDHFTMTTPPKANCTANNAAGHP